MVDCEHEELVDYGTDDHPADDPERVQITWIVAVLDDCEECEEPRIELTPDLIRRAAAPIERMLAVT